MLIKNNVSTGLEWRFGSNWPGERCGAKTRKGTPCQRPANKKMDDAGSMVVQALDREPRWGVQGSQLLIFVMESIQKISLKSGERMLPRDEKFAENSVRWNVS